MYVTKVVKETWRLVVILFYRGKKLENDFIDFQLNGNAAFITSLGK